MTDGRELEYLSSYSNGLQAGWLEFDPWQVQGIFLYSTASKMALWRTQPSTQWLLGALYLGVKLTGHLHPVLRSRMVELYLHSPIHLHGMVLN
jgi:hypothetical protein